MRWMSLLLLLAACAKSPVAVSPPPPPPPPLHDPEIYFHFRYQHDSAGAVIPYADTAVMRWYDGTPANKASAINLAQVEITGIDSTCAYFLVAKGTPMYFDISWRHKGVLSTIATMGPFNPANPDDYDTYWDVEIAEDSLAMTGGITHNPTLSFCPKSVTRDSVTPAAIP